MIFQRLLKMTRPSAQATKDPEALSRIARGSDDVASRRDACRRLTSLADLREICAADPDAVVREIALARYRHLLCDDAEQQLSLEERLRELESTSDERTLEQIATSAANADFRRAAIDRVGGSATLAACALHDPLSSNRCAATARLSDRAALEQIVKQIGKKDKRVYRLARQQLRAIAEREALPRRIRDQCEELCQRTERLGRFGQWEQDRGLLDLIEREWTELKAQADKEFQDRIQRGRAQFLANYEAYRQQNASQLAAEQAQAERRAALQQLLAELSEATQLDDEAALTSLRARAERIRADGPARPGSEQARLDKQLDQAMATLAHRMDQLARRHEGCVRVEAAQKKIAEMLAQPQPLTVRQARAQIAEAQTLIASEAFTPPSIATLAQASAALERRLDKQCHSAVQRIAQLQAKLPALEASLSEGELKRAEPLLQSLQAGIELAQASDLPATTYAEILRSVQQAAPRIRELQRWRRWGTDQQRDALCTAIDELAECNDSPETLSLRLREIQSAWKSLDQTGAPAHQRSWEHFHQAAERIYERCRPFLEQQAAEREANRRAREQICEQLEHFLEKVDWDRVDWKKAVQAAREMRRDWGQIGPTEARHRKGLEGRFRSSIKHLERQLKAERAQNRRYREDLIAEVEALIEVPDLDRAIEAAKDCQQRWHTTVAGRKADENALWQRFRAACDAVFGRRRVQIEAREAALQDHLAARAAILDEARTLAASQAPPDEIEAGLQTLEQRWQDTAAHLPLPRNAAQTLRQRWRDAREEVLEALHQSRNAARRGTLQLLSKQAELCADLERVALGEGSDGNDLSTIKAAWSALPRHQDEALQTAIGARFASALAMLERGAAIPAELLAENHQEREALCLRLEILAQVDSPAELADERLAFQVTRLTERMAAGEKDPLASAAGLLSKWYLCGPTPTSTDLERRFARVRAALGQAGQPSETDGDPA